MVPRILQEAGHGDWLFSIEDGEIGGEKRWWVAIGDKWIIENVEHVGEPSEQWLLQEHAAASEASEEGESELQGPVE